MGLWKSSGNFTTCYFSFIPISLFDLKAHFFAPTRSVQTLSRAGLSRLAVAQISPHAPGDARPHLDSSEHGSTLVVVGMTMSRGARLWRMNSRAATLYSVGRNDPDHDAVLRIGSEAPRRRPILHNGVKAMVYPGPRHLEPSLAIPHRGADRAETVRLLATCIQ